MKENVKTMLIAIRDKMTAQKNKPLSRATILEDASRWGTGRLTRRLTTQWNADTCRNRTENSTIFGP